MSFPRYPKYKDSGVDWLGEVPEHWEICSMKRIASLQSGESITAEQIEVVGTFPVFGGNGLRGYCDAYTHDGEFALIGRQGALCGNINYADGKFWASEHAVVVTPKRPIATKWLGELLRAMNLNQYSVSAAQPGLSVEIVGNLGIPVPSGTEQAAIAVFLDRETAKIDALVAEQEQLISLLKEKRQAVISHAVTKGLDPSVPMKDSGVEWLGEVPAHWQVIPLKHLVDESLAGPYGASLTKDMYSSEGYRVYGQQQVIADDFTVGDYFISEEKYGEMRRYTVHPDDLLVSVMGTIGKVAVVTSDAPPGIINPRLVRYRCSSQIQPRFVQRVLMSQKHQEHLLFEAKGTTMDGLNMQTLGRVPVPVPPLDEQAAILDFVAQRIGELDPLLTEAQATVDLLQERRSALISAAVTGQIDVRSL